MNKVILAVRRFVSSAGRREMKRFALCILAVVPVLFVTGCFSAMQNFNDAITLPSSPSKKAGAVALDVVTFPLQVPFWLAIAADDASSQSGNQRAAKTDGEDKR